MAEKVEYLEYKISKKFVTNGVYRDIVWFKKYFSLDGQLPLCQLFPYSNQHSNQSDALFTGYVTVS